MANLGTGRIISSYIRPRLIEIKKEELDKSLSMFSGEQIGPNMWRIRTVKNPLLRGTWLTGIAIRKQGTYYTTQIPTDKTGCVTQMNMAERLLDVESGDRAGHVRNVMIDCSQDALKVTDGADKAKTYQWFLYPNETDVKYIDDSHTKIVEILGKSGPNGEITGRSSRILIVGGTDEERETIGRNIANNFTVREKRIIANCLIEIVGNNHGFAGCFQGHSDSKGNILGTPKIQITKGHVNTADVVVHEAIHALRQFDGDRDEKLRAVKHYFGKDADLEESLTEAETTARESPFKRGDNYKAGYYHYLKVPKGTKADMSWSEVRPGAESLDGKNDSDHSYYIGITPNKEKYFVTYDRSSKHWIILDEMRSRYGLASFPGAESAKKYAEARFNKSTDNKTSGELVTEDRVTITGSKEKGLKGKRVQKTILLKYPLTNIAHLKIKGAAEAIDTYYEVGNRLPRLKGEDKAGEVKTSIHFYDPDATLATDKEMDQTLKAESPGAHIIQYEDGKPVQIQAAETAARPTKDKPHKFGYYWDDEDKLVYPGGTQIGRVHKVNDHTWYSVVNGSVVGEFDSKEKALDHVTEIAGGEYTESEKIAFEAERKRLRSRNRAKDPSFKRPAGSAGGPGKAPKSKTPKAQKVGPYFHRGGRLSRRPC